MDSGGGGAGLSVYGLRSVGIEAAEVEKGELLPPTAWSASVWKRKPTSLAAPPGFTETEDGEDYMSGLAEEIAQSMLEENEENAFKMQDSLWGAQAFLSTSPQSTLAGMSSWDLLSPGASSSGGLSSGVSSPPTPVAATQKRREEDDALDLLYAELLRLKMEDEIKARQQQLLQLKQQQHYQQLLWKLRQKQAASLSSEAMDAYKMSQLASCQKASGATSVYYRSKARSEETSQVRARNKQASAPWGTQSHAQSQHNRQRGWDSSGGQPQYSAFAVNTVSHQKAMNGSGMRAVFLGTPGARESGGTGVFLPRRVGTGHDSKRKPACSTVLLPSRIVQALNLNVEATLVCGPSSAPSHVTLRRDIYAPSSATRIRGPSNPMEDVAVVDPRDQWASHHYTAAACSSLQEVAPDVCLPTEWTY